MNAIFFGAKRVFHSALRVTRGSFESIAPGLTAARFDMMFALTAVTYEEREAVEVAQSSLRRILDVSGPVAGRMLRSLEALGWVSRRRRPNGDQRQRWVKLTDDGLRVAREAYKLMYRVAAKIVYHAICFGKHRDDRERFHHMDTLESYLRSLRAYCRDNARLYYAWGHPDD